MLDPKRVVVLGHRAHSIPLEEYVTALRERLPDYEVELARTPAAEREAVAGTPVVAGAHIDEELLEAADSLRLFACGSAGVEHLPMEALAARDVVVTNASGVHGPNMAEHVIGWFLAFARRLDEAHRRTARREWRHFQSHELYGSTVTVVGLGAIGQAIVERLDGFGVETIGVRYTPEKGGPTDEVVGFDDESLQAALARTDYLAIACPLTDTTRGLIGSEEFRVLPPDAVLVNVARGPVVETDALVDALRGNELRAAGLDVTEPEPLPEDHPLWGFENVQISPHNSGYTPEYYERLADVLAENLDRIAETGSLDDLRNLVLAPSED